METRKDGFTLIEILTVIGIMSLLLGAIIAVTARSPERAKAEGTKGMLLELSMALKRYHNEFYAFPPDGYDTEVVAPNGTELRGSACLTYFLAWKYPDGQGGFIDYDMKRPVYLDSQNIAWQNANQGMPYWQGCKPKDDLNRFGEILDKFVNPLRYDNCERQQEDGTVRYSPHIQPAKESKDPDPRADNNEDRPFNSGSYDLWSCGVDGGEPDAEAEDDLISGREAAK